MNKSLATQRNFDRAERPRASMAPALRTLLALFVVCSGGCSFASLQSGVDADDAGLDTALVSGAAISAARAHIPPVVHLLRTPLLAAALILRSFHAAVQHGGCISPQVEASRHHRKTNVC